MNTNLTTVLPVEHSLPPDVSVDGIVQDKKSDSRKPHASSGCFRRNHQCGKVHPRLGSYLAFLAAVLVSMVAAATVASNDVPLMLGGF